MYNPINRILNEISRKETGRIGRPHCSVTSLEIVAAISFLPGMFIFLFAFVLSGAALAASFEVSKGVYGPSALIFILLNIIPGLGGLLSACLDPEYLVKGYAMFVIYGGIGFWGLVSIWLQKRHLENAS